MFLLSNCSQAPKDSTALADSANHERDSTNKNGVGGYVNQLSEDDTKFAVAAANGGMEEVELGTLAREKAADARVKEFGTMMVDDHSKANAKLMQIAKDHQITMPTALNAEAQKMKDELSSKSGAEFDKAYVTAMVNDHEKDISEFERAYKVAKYDDLRAFIGETLPVLRKHLDHIKEIQQQLK